MRKEREVRERKREKKREGEVKKRHDGKRRCRRRSGEAANVHLSS